MTMPDLRYVVRDLRGDRTQAEFAAALGRTQAAVSYWESGKRTPSLDDLRGMLVLTGRDWASIFGQGTTLGAYRAGFAAGVEAARRALAGVAVPEHAGLGAGRDGERDVNGFYEREGLGTWQVIGLEEWRKLIADEGGVRSLVVFSSLTDPEGTFGPAQIYTAWGRYGDPMPLVDVRDYKAEDGSTERSIFRKFVSAPAALGVRSDTEGAPDA